MTKEGDKMLMDVAGLEQHPGFAPRIAAALQQGQNAGEGQSMPH
jgi:hypothetical protein